MALWVKGQSGNPSGKPASTAETKKIRALAKQHAEEAFRVLLDLMQNAEAESTRRAAARDVLDMAGVFKEQDGDEKGASVNPFAGKTPDELLALAERRDDSH